MITDHNFTIYPYFIAAWNFTVRVTSEDAITEIAALSSRQ